MNLVAGNVDILVITESKIDSTFLSSEFYIDGYAKPFRCDRNKNGGGVIIFIRGDIPCKELKKHIFSMDIEGIFIEINLRKGKWILFGGYNPRKGNTTNFFNKVRECNG